MPSWDEILLEINKNKEINGGRAFDLTISKYVNELSKYRKRNVIVYYSDFMNIYKGPNLGINDNDLDAFMNAVKGLDKTKGLDLIINTPGGDALATEGIVKYLHSIFNNDIEVFVPRMAMSAGTMLACSSNLIWMGKHSFLGPIILKLMEYLHIILRKNLKMLKLNWLKILIHLDIGKLI